MREASPVSEKPRPRTALTKKWSSVGKLGLAGGRGLAGSLGSVPSRGLNQDVREAAVSGSLGELVPPDEGGEVLIDPDLRPSPKAAAGSARCSTRAVISTAGEGESGSRAASRRRPLMATPCVYTTGSMVWP